MAKTCPLDPMSKMSEAIENGRGASSCVVKATSADTTDSMSPTGRLEYQSMSILRM